MIHAKLPAVPRIAIVANMAVKREPPNKLIAHHPPMCTILRQATQHYLRRALGAPSTTHIRASTTNTQPADFVPPQCAGNSTKPNFLGDGDATPGGIRGSPPGFGALSTARKGVVEPRVSL
jgi:hypothetical protein